MQVQDPMGQTPLHRGAIAGKTECLRLLLQDERCTSDTVRSPQHDSVCPSALGSECSPLASCRMGECRGCVQQVNIKDDMGRTVMHWACLHNRKDMVTMCIKRGINIGIVDKSGRLAEDLAAQKGHRELLAWLNEGAFPKSENPHLMRAAAAVKRNHRERKVRTWHSHHAVEQ